MMEHTCSYYCERPECIRAQRDELRDRLGRELAAAKAEAAAMENNWMCAEEKASRREAEAEALREACELIWQWQDMMTDGPDDSDIALANSWFENGLKLIKEWRRNRAATIGGVK